MIKLSVIAKTEAIEQKKRILKYQLIGEKASASFISDEELQLGEEFTLERVKTKTPGTLLKLVTSKKNETIS